MALDDSTQPSEPLAVDSLPVDAVMNAALARLTHGLSPAAILAACFDWGTHLALSPGKQWELQVKALRKLGRLAAYAGSAWRGDSAPCIEPLLQDQRFAAPAWGQAPFNVLHQGFLLWQQWWWNATTGVRGVSAHHEDVMQFMARQALDTVSPSNFVPTNPEVLAETVHTGGANLVQGMLNWWEDVLAMLSNRPPPGAARWKVGTSLATTPGKVVLRNRLVELIQYAPTTAQVRPEPLLMVPSWIMKYYILDLQATDSFVRHAIDQGFTVFMISWKNPGPEFRDTGLDDYLKEGVLAALDAVCKIAPGRRVHGLGYCLGGTLLAMAAALLARAGDERVATLTLLAAELDFEEPGELGLFIDDSQIAFLENIMFLRGYLDGKEMAGAFALLNSKDLVFSRSVRDYLMGRRDQVSDLMAWNADATRMPYRMHSEYLRRLYLANELAQGSFMVDGRPLALDDVRLPVFAVGAERDHVVPWRSAYKAQRLFDGDVTFLLASGGHNVGVVSPPCGSPQAGFRVATHRHGELHVDPDAWYDQAPRTTGSWWPQWTDWLAERSGTPVAPCGMGAPACGLPTLCDAPGVYALEA